VAFSQGTTKPPPFLFEGFAVSSAPVLSLSAFGAPFSLTHEGESKTTPSSAMQVPFNMTALPRRVAPGPYLVLRTRFPLVFCFPSLKSEPVFFFSRFLFPSTAFGRQSLPDAVRQPLIRRSLVASIFFFFN